MWSEQLSVMKVFPSGAKRSKDADGTRLDLIPLEFLRRVGATLMTGAEKYGEFNWQKGMPIAECANHALQHLYKYLDGDTSEDHIAHAACNLAFIAHYEKHNADLKSTFDNRRPKPPRIEEPGNV